MTLLDIIRNKLIAASVVEGSTGFKIFIGYAPDDQDDIVALTTTGGWAQDTHDSANVLESFQAKIRGNKFDYVACESKWRDVFNVLQDADMSADGIHYIQALATGPLAWIDPNHRHCMSINFKVVRSKP